MIKLLRDHDFMKKFNSSLIMATEALGIDSKTYDDGTIADFEYKTHVDEDERNFWLEVLEDKLRDNKENLEDETEIEKIGEKLYWEFYEYMDALEWINERLADEVKDRLSRLYKVEIGEDKSKKIDEILKIDQWQVIYHFDFDPRDHISEIIEKIESEKAQEDCR